MVVVVAVVMAVFNLPGVTDVEVTSRSVHTACTSTVTADAVVS
jgi:hypothetical protein